MTLVINKEKRLSEQLGKSIYIVGAQWGDEGKGKLVDILSADYDMIARSAGGANAGHTICVNENGVSKKYVFHLLPSGILHEGKMSIIGNGTVINVPTMLEEISELKEKGIEVKGKLLLSDRAHLLLGYHKLIDGIQEENKKDRKVGTTLRGIGPAYTDKVSRIGIRVGDLLNFNRFAEKLRANAERHMKAYGFEFDIEGEINYYKDAIEVIQEYIVNTSNYVNNAVKNGKTLLIEGAQGSQLDIDHGTYPYVTSSNTTCGGASTGLGFPPNQITNVIGIMKAYTTRVGEGPFPTELANMEGDMLRNQGGEYGATTGRPRRCGWLDLVVAKDSARINGITSFNLTKLDVLTNVETIKIATKYTLEGTEIDYLPSSLEDFGNVKVTYQEFEGWTEDISKAESFDELPKNAQAYVKFIEDFLGIPVNFIGVGVHRADMIFR